jgi:hypothetical protein
VPLPGAGKKCSRLGFVKQQQIWLAFVQEEQRIDDRGAAKKSTDHGSRRSSVARAAVTLVMLLLSDTQPRLRSHHAVDAAHGR